ncbi:hypothetical protein [Solimonas variicoloris]|uniref:hypothetical protein n=1 Tax=Solimonas variicoloris TaxID=254408 RepID=UPI0012B60013|nr:hypothetical protein [Solimonas variicoloris]
MTRAHAHAVRRMCPDCEALNADRARVARDAGLVESAVVIDIKTRRVGSGQHFLCLGCAPARCRLASAHGGAPNGVAAQAAGKGPARRSIRNLACRAHAPPRRRRDAAA